jgi:hypothetical protein
MTATMTATLHYEWRHRRTAADAHYTMELGAGVAVARPRQGGHAVYARGGVE